MKKLIFIDNDDKKYSDSFGELDMVKDILEDNGILDLFNNKIEAIYDFHRLDRDNVYEILFNKDNIICTFSTYTATHLNSLGQLFSYLSAAGRNEIKDRIYIDCSGSLIDTLNRNLDSAKNLFQIINGIETNFILTRTGKYFKRIRLKFTGCYKNPVILEDFDLKQHLIIPISTKPVNKCAVCGKEIHTANSTFCDICNATLIS